MAGDASEVQQIASLLSQAVSANIEERRNAEQTLLRLESSRNYGVSLLSITNLADISFDCRLSAAIAFKNFIKNKWPFNIHDESSDQVDMLGDQQRDTIKQHITKIMLESPDHIQRQLSEAISIIGKSDFPEKWPSLILELEHAMSQNIAQNFHHVQGVLLTGHSIFRRYRHELASERLWSEIKVVVKHFAEPLTQRFKELVAATSMVTQDVPNAKLVFQSLLLTVEIYNSLITQDLPEYFEDHINDWLPNFLELLKINQNLPDSCLIESMKAEICETASMFLERFYDADDFKGYTEKFAEGIWNLLVTTNQDSQYDGVVSSALRFLITLARRPESRPIFQADNVLNLLCEQVIIPNLTLRDIDQELFEDDPDEYVKRDMEGSDVDTRRRAACDLVQVLSKFLEGDMIKTFEGYIGRMLEMHNGDREANWKYKDTAIFVYSAMATRSSTRQDGAVSISQLVNVEKFLTESITQELSFKSSHIGSQILKADALRFITNFRNHIPLPILMAHLETIVHHITHESVVVRTYAAITLDRILIMRDPAQPKTTAFKPEQLEVHMKHFLEALIRGLKMRHSFTNRSMMSAIMRLFSFSRPEFVRQFVPSVSDEIFTMAGLNAKDPIDPNFNHYIFETLAIIVKACWSDDERLKNLEDNLFVTSRFLGTVDWPDFAHYLLQLVNLVLRNPASTSVSPEALKFIDDYVLTRILWENPANTRPLVELLHTYVIKLGPTLNSSNKLVAVLGIFQKLIESKATDHEALDLLRSMMIHVPVADMDIWMRDILYAIFNRLQRLKTPKLVRQVITTFSLYAYLRGPDVLETSVNQFSDDIFARVISLFISDARAITGYLESRLCKVGIIKILTHPPFIQTNRNLWSSLLLVLLEMFELPQESPPEDENHFADIAEALEFQVKYCKLTHASVKRDDPTKSIGDLKCFLATSISSLSGKLPGVVAEVLRTETNPAVVACLANYCQAANVTIL